MHLAHKVKDIGRRQLAANAQEPAPLSALGIAKTHAILPFPTEKNRRVAVGARGHDTPLSWFCLLSLSMQIARGHSSLVARLRGAEMLEGQARQRLFGEHCGTVPWASPAGAVSASACHDNGRWSVGDARPCEMVQVEQFGKLPAAADRLVARIVSEEGTACHAPGGPRAAALDARVAAVLRSAQRGQLGHRICTQIPCQTQPETPLIDRVIRIAQVLALLWIGYELHGLASTEPAAEEPETTVNQAPSDVLRG